MTTDKPTTDFAEREQAALRWMYAGVERGVEPQMTLTAMFQERANAEGRMADECMRVVARVTEGETVLRTLIDRLDEIHEHPAYRSVWTINQIHVGPYSGPTYEAELKAARDYLDSLEIAAVVSADEDLITTYDRLKADPHLARLLTIEERKLAITEYLARHFDIELPDDEELDRLFDELAGVSAEEGAA